MMPSISLWLSGMVIFGSMASLRPRSVTILALVSRTSSSMVSAITPRPYTFLRWVTGTLPGRNPRNWTRSLSCVRRSFSRASSSDAGTTTLNSRFRPSVLVSVTCMGSNARLLRVEVASVLGPAAGCVEGYGDACRRPRRMVRAEGFEPPRLASLEPKSSASTNSATPAEGSAAAARRGLYHAVPRAHHKNGGAESALLPEQVPIDRGQRFAQVLRYHPRSG